MPLAKIHNVGRVGIIQDIPPHELPPEAWTNGLNVRMYDGAVWKSFGNIKIADPPLGTPYFLVPAFTAAGNQLFAYAGTTDIWATDGVTHAEITRISGDYTGAVTDLWNGGAQGQVAIFNNGINVPQAWILPDLGTKLVDLANWPANVTAKVIRPFGRFLVAYDVTKAGVRSPQLIKWSNRAEPGAVPTSWDETDPTERAGEWPLSDTDGAIIDALTLGRVNWVYKEDEIHSMEEIGGNFVFRFSQQKFSQVGLLAQRCVKAYQKGDKLVHVLMSPEDILWHDGFQMDSLLDKKMRRWYKGRIDPSKAKLSFLAPNYAEDEMWAGITEAGQEYPNLALIINMKDGTTTIRDLPNVSHIAWAAFDPDAGSTTFDEQLTSFDQMVGQFGQRTFSPGRRRLLMVVPSVPKFLLADQDFTDDGAHFSAFIERTGLAVAETDRFGQPKVDIESIKLVTEVWPRVRVLNGDTINVYVGTQEKLEGPITWSPAMPFNPTTMDKVDVDPPLAGRYIAVRFESPAANNVLWKLDGYDLNVSIIGRY